MFNVEPRTEWNAEDAAEFEQQSAADLKKTWISAGWAGGALAGNIICVVPFLYGWPLHNYWNSIGKYLILTPMAWLLWFTYRAGLVWVSWQSARETRRQFGDQQ